ncbi:MAG TPA: trypsin-like peptidase domain-containing protein [Ktedonobacterales bacterium]
MTNEYPPNYSESAYPPAVPTMTPPPVPGPTADQPQTQAGGGIPPWPPRYEYLNVRPSGRPGMSWARLALIITGVFAILALGIGGGLLLGHGIPGTTKTPVTLGAATAPVSNVPTNVNDLQATVQQVAKAVQPSVVEIKSQSARGSAIGSGEVLTTDGYIVTNDHVVTGFSSYTVMLSTGTQLPAQMVGEDPQDDLAVLKVTSSNLTPIAIGDSSQAQVGEFVLALGSPLGLDQSVSFGIVSALDRTASEAPQGPAGQLTGLIQTSAPINPGNSGGALVDLHGQLIGIPTLAAVNDQTGTTATGIGFAIPSNRVKYVAQQLIANGHLVNSGQGYLGVVVQDVTSDVATANGLTVNSGALIKGFSADASGATPAQAAGVRQGDVIVGVDSHTVTDSASLASALSSQAPDAKVSLAIVRGSQHLTIQVTLGERPANPQG